MSRETALIVLGVLVALSPYLGFPLSVLYVVLPVLGLLVMGIGVTLRLRHTRPPSQPRPERIASVYETPEA